MKHTIADRLEQYGEAARKRLAPAFVRADLTYPPRNLLLLGLKEEKRLEIFVRNKNGAWAFLTHYPILAASGQEGPKLREGDRQVPEGFYHIELLNPNSRYHLSLRVNYPNAEDHKNAKADGRARLGGDIMIHGSARSIGCLAIGDRAAEEMFILAADTGIENIEVLLVPWDFRKKAAPAKTNASPQWLPELYARLTAAMRDLPGH